MHTGTQLTDVHLDQLEREGFVIVHDFLPEADLPELSAAMRRVLKPWDQVMHDPPAERTAFAPWPSGEPALLRLCVQPEAVRFARKWLRTDHIHYRAGMHLVRYPGFRGDAGLDGLHQDTGNNSLLPPSDSDRTHAQIQFWIHVEEVGEDQAPLRLVPKRFGRDLSRAVTLAVPANTLCVFHNYTWHSASDYTRSDGQRYTWGTMFGRADHYYEGFRHYTDKGLDPNFRKLVSMLTADERTLLRFPPPGDPYYTPQTLAALERQYPGWNARGEYGEPAPAAEEAVAAGR